MFNKKYIPAKIFLCVLFVLMCLAFGGYIAAKLTPESNLVDGYVLYDVEWEKLYPFTYGKTGDYVNKFDKSKEDAERETLLEKIIHYAVEGSTLYTTDRLIGYVALVEIARAYEELIDWNIAPISDYNGVVRLGDGQLTTMLASKDVTPNIKSTVELAKFCADRNIDFMYVQAPHKNCKIEDAEISGILDFSNQRADDLLKGLTEAGVKNYDFRKMLHDDGKNHHASFYITDHHWRAEMGIWATRHILKILREDFKWPVDENILDEKNFEFVKYPNNFFGSHGKKWTLARSNYEDFVFVYPKDEYKTQLSLEIPSIGISNSGDFTVLLDYRKLSRSENNYHAYMSGTVMHIENSLATNDKKILILRASFSNIIIPFLSLAVRHLDAIHPGGFPGSIRNYIEQTKPDLVIVLYNPSYISGLEHDTQRSTFDFR